MTMTERVFCAAGEVYSYGHNLWGQLGIGSNTATISTPTLMVDMAGKTVTHIAAGWNHLVVIAGEDQQLGICVAGTFGHYVTLKCACVADGKLYTCGYNNKGQLGIGSTTTKTSPMEVTGVGAGTAEMAVAGEFNTLVVVDGNVWSWGDNLKGQLGNGTTTQQNSPQQVSFFDDKQVQSLSESSRNLHHLVVTYTAWGTELYAFGYNHKGQLGLQETEATPPNHLSPQLVTFFAGKTVQLSVVGLWHSLVVAGE